LGRLGLKKRRWTLVGFGISKKEDREYNRTRGPGRWWTERRGPPRSAQWDLLPKREDGITKLQTRHGPSQQRKAQKVI